MPFIPVMIDKSTAKFHKHHNKDASRKKRRYDWQIHCVLLHERESRKAVLCSTKPQMLLNRVISIQKQCYDRLKRGTRTKVSFYPILQHQMQFPGTITSNLLPNIHITSRRNLLTVSGFQELLCLHHMFAYLRALADHAGDLSHERHAQVFTGCEDFWRVCFVQSSSDFRDLFAIWKRILKLTVQRRLLNRHQAHLNLPTIQSWQVPLRTWDSLSSET